VWEEKMCSRFILAYTVAFFALRINGTV